MVTELVKGFHAVGLGLWAKPDNVLIIGDLHLGYEDYLHSKGMLLPRVNFAEIKKNLAFIFAQRDFFEQIILNGDLKHEFGKISGQEWLEVGRLIELLQKHCAEIVLVQGNHDSILGPVAKFESIRLEKEGCWLEKSKTFVTHGHKIFSKNVFFKKAKIIVIGNEHPAISLKEGPKTEKFKSFLIGKFQSKQLIVCPSFFALREGTDLLRDNVLSPFLKQNLSKFKAFLVEGNEIFPFGKLAKIKELLN